MKFRDLWTYVLVHWDFSDNEINIYLALFGSSVLNCDLGLSHLPLWSWYLDSFDEYLCFICFIHAVVSP